jgi:hypothetical protein
MRPAFQMGLEHPAFGELLARTLAAPPPFLHAMLHEEMEPNALLFISALRRALPALPEGLLWLRLALSMGPLLMLTVQIGKTRAGSRPTQDEAVLREVIRFASNGMASEPAGADGRHLMRLVRVARPRRSR